MEISDQTFEQLQRSRRGAKITCGHICVALGAIAAILFLWLASINIEAQGLYQDELFQATGAFAYKGKAPIGVMVFAGIPILNSSYVGAIKTGFYGLYLAAFRDFSVASWRMVGIGFVSLGLFGFGWLARNAMTPAAMAVFFALILTDSAVLLSSRHDYGPTALSLTLRLLLIATALAGSAERPARPRNSALLGFLVGISIFEKLSNAALLPILVFWMVAHAGRRTRNHWIACSAGLLASLLPLVFVNLLSLMEFKNLISLASDGGLPHQPSIAEFLREIRIRYFSVSTGEYLRLIAVGQHTTTAIQDQEFGVLGLLLALVLAMGVAARSRCAAARRILESLAIFLGAGVLVYLLPKVTSFHHQIMVTPFQYAAIAMAVDIRSDGGTLRKVLTNRFTQGLRVALLVTTAFYLLLHFGWTRDVARDLAAGKTGSLFQKGFTEIGKYAAERKESSLFLSAAWGTWGQMYCLSDGDLSFIYELFWNYSGHKDIRRIIDVAAKRTIYVVTPIRPFGAQEHPPYVKRINDDIAHLDGWREVAPDDVPPPVEKTIQLRKFIRE